MTRTTDFETKVRVRALHEIHLSTQQIVKQLSESGIITSKRTVKRIVDSAEKEKSGHVKSPRKFG